MGHCQDSDQGEQIGQRSAAGMADLPAQGVWAEVSGPAVEPAILPRRRVPAAGASLARDEAAAGAAGGARGAREARGGGARAAAAEPEPEQAVWQRRFDGGRDGFAARRVVTQRTPSSRHVVRPAWLLRAAAELLSIAVGVLQRRLPWGHAAGEGPRTQVVGPQDESGPAETPLGIPGRGEEAAPVAAGERRFSAIRSGSGRRPDKNCGRRLWAGRAIEQYLSGNPQPVRRSCRP